MDRLTHRPLPLDPSLESVSADERAQVAAAWTRRAQNELSTSTVFASLTRSLVAVHAPYEIVRQAAAAVEDEVRHAQICVAVARAYRPKGPPPAPSVVANNPPTSDGDGAFPAFLYLMMQSCINEGVACAYLQRCLADATHPLARAAVRDILTDEISHARFGWTLLASKWTPTQWRGAVSEALPTLLERIADAWLVGDETELLCAPDGHGTLSQDTLSRVVRAAFEELILPGFDETGIDSAPARDWLLRRTWGSKG